MTPQVAPIPVGHIPAAAVADQDMEDITMLDDDGSDIGDDDDDMGDDSGEPYLRRKCFCRAAAYNQNLQNAFWHVMAANTRALSGDLCGT